MSDRVDDNRRDYNRDVTRTRNDLKNTPSTRSADEKSAFDKIMEARQIQLQNPETSTATREAVKAPLSQQERFGKEKENFQKKLEEKEKDSDEKKTSDAPKSGANRAKQAEKKVVSRESSQEKGEGQSSKDQKGGEGGQQGGQKGQGGSGQNTSSNKGNKGGDKRDQGLQASKSSASESKIQRSEKGNFQIQLAEAASSSATKNAALPRTLSKAVLDQIVQYSRIMTRTDGDKEMEMQLKEEVFRGLRLRVRLKDGKVMATFITHSEAVRNLFQSQKAEITKSLEEKGIVVSSLNVIFS